MTYLHVQIRDRMNEMLTYKKSNMKKDIDPLLVYISEWLFLKYKDVNLGVSLLVTSPNFGSDFFF